VSTNLDTMTEIMSWPFLQQCTGTLPTLTGWYIDWYLQHETNTSAYKMWFTLPNIEVVADDNDADVDFRVLIIIMISKPCVWRPPRPLRPWNVISWYRRPFGEYIIGMKRYCCYRWRRRWQHNGSGESHLIHMSKCALLVCTG